MVALARALDRVGVVRAHVHGHDAGQQRIVDAGVVTLVEHGPGDALHVRRQRGRRLCHVRPHIPPNHTLPREPAAGLAGVLTIE